ncbi:MAG: hypothetical protein GX951_05115 [Mollicutes bacterium]|nr:hypothetical protein [Mollicutes bacterium]
MKKIKSILIILGLFLSIVPFFIVPYLVLKLISLLVGIIILSLGIIINMKHSLIRIILIPIILMLAFYFIDIGVSNLFKKPPIIAIKNKSSNKVVNYNGIFYYVVTCDKEYYFQKGTNYKYMCKNDDIKVTDINEYLENPEESYRYTKNKFIHLTGKINTIVGDSLLSLNAYNKDEDNTLNGYVNFDTGKKVVLSDIKISPNDFYIYDIIEVIGYVSNYKITEDSEEIILNNCKIIKSKIYDNYTLIVNEINTYNKVLANDKIYYAGLSGIYYKYTEDNIYSIDYLLTDKRETIESLIQNEEEALIPDTEDILYEKEKYNIILCKNENIIFANKKMPNIANICEDTSNS